MSVETMYDEKPPSHNYIRNALIIAFLIGIAALFLAPLSGCNLIKTAERNHAEKKIDKIHDRFPDILALKMAQYYPPHTSIGTTVNDPDSNHYYKNLADSLQDIFNKREPTFIFIRDTINHVTDTCEMISNDADSYNQGYQIGLYKGKSQCPVSTHRVDTVLSSGIQNQIEALKKDTSNKHDAILGITTQSNIYKSERNHFVIAFSILLFLVITGGIIAAVRKYYKSKLPLV